MSQKDIYEFFQIIYGNNSPGYLTVWNLKDKRTKWFEASNLEEVSSIAFNLSKDRDVYFGIGLRKTKLTQLKRGTLQDILAIPGIWLDVDIYDNEAHVSKDLPKDLTEAISLLNNFSLKPTILIHSGHGINPLYLFQELWTFQDEQERDKAQTLCSNFNKAMISVFSKNGYKLDNVSDLARTIRIPYTTNFKTRPVPVKIIEYNPEARYTLDKTTNAIQNLVASKK